MGGNVMDRGKPAYSQLCFVSKNQREGRREGEQVAERREKNEQERTRGKKTTTIKEKPREGRGCMSPGPSPAAACSGSGPGLSPPPSFPLMAPGFSPLPGLSQGEPVSVVARLLATRLWMVKQDRSLKQGSGVRLAPNGPMLWKLIFFY